MDTEEWKIAKSINFITKPKTAVTADTEKRKNTTSINLQNQALNSCNGRNRRTGKYDEY